MIFADTGALFAAFVPNDPDHPAADAWLTAHTEPLVTTDYVVDELLTLLKIRGEFQRALHLGQRLLTEEIIDIAWVTPGDVQQAWDVYRKHQDKAWSFTDCVYLTRPKLTHSLLRHTNPKRKRGSAFRPSLTLRVSVSIGREQYKSGDHGAAWYSNRFRLR